MPHVQNEYTGRTMVVTFGAITLEGVTKVNLSEEDGPDAEQLDVTCYSDTVYTFMQDPLGSKGDDKATLVATCWASTQSYSMGTMAAIPFNTESLLTFDTQSGTAGANTWSLATMQLTKRVTRIPYDGYATCELTFEANDLGVWAAPA